MSEDAETAVQVVKVGANHSYHLDEVALEQILLREDVKDLPVVVVSVAGAYRGGKSFLLDFFLRYLRTPRSNDNDVRWLGDPDEPLRGFSWRGGSERNTTGMLLWSEPIKSTLPSGETVAVLLIDTQGTFDSRSTVRDCSTIFALSTLLSSVQIYNLSQNIREDDIQHLQLFSAYGRLASNEEEKPFQVLQFLVRDWMFPYEHPFGACGGNQLLDKRLQIEEDQAPELRELRDHIRSYFDEFTCFLMPHPGFAVSDPSFNGRLSDLREEFKESLLELIPSIFSPSKLTPKTINGQKVKAKELLTYFKTYMNIFNIDELPTPVSILKATSEAGMLAAMMAARELYEAEMERSCGPGQLNMPAVLLRQVHHAALAAAAVSFSSKKKMGSQEDADAYLEELIQDLGSRLKEHLMLNEVKMQRAIANSKKDYEEALNRVSKEQSLCLHPVDLEEVHRDAVAAAVALFDSNRKPLECGSDDERSALLQDFEERLNQLRVMNEQNNMAAVMQAYDQYKGYMDNLVQIGLCVSTQYLNEKHQQGLDAALATFKSKRNRFNEYSDDDRLSQLIQKITEQFNTLESINGSKNNTAKHTVICGYNNHMASIWGPQTSYLQPDDLRQKHEGALERALAEFRSCWVHDVDDDENNMIREILNVRYEELININAVRKPVPTENKRGKRKWQRVLRRVLDL